MIFFYNEWFFVSVIQGTAFLVWELIMIKCNEAKNKVRGNKLKIACMK